jgi:hypothetical protein
MGRHIVVSGGGTDIASHRSNSRYAAGASGFFTFQSGDGLDGYGPSTKLNRHFVSLTFIDAQIPQLMFYHHRPT